MENVELNPVSSIVRGQEDRGGAVHVVRPEENRTKTYLRPKRAHPLDQVNCRDAGDNVYVGSRQPGGQSFLAMNDGRPESGAKDGGDSLGGPGGISGGDLRLRSRLVPKTTQPTDSEFDARLARSLSNESAGSFGRKP